MPRPNANNVPRANGAPRSVAGTDNNGWRRFGDPGAGSSFRQTQTPAAQAGQENGWHRFGAPTDAAPRSNQNSSRGGNDYGRFQQYGRPDTGYRSEQPMRTNPSIVRDRPYSSPSMNQPRVSEPRMSEPRMSEPRMSAPRMSEPRMSAPRYSAPSGGGRSAPAPSRSEGGGGNGRSGGGSGGGHRR